MKTTKPTLDDVLGFAEEKKPSKSGKVPGGDVRLTVNVAGDLHLKLKIEAATRRMTMGELIEDLIRGMNH